RRDYLAALFWPELDQSHARNALRKALHALRGSLGAETLPGRGVEEMAIAPDRLMCDATLFVADIDAGRLGRAMERYAGDLMPGFHLSDCAEFERWVDE